jgi:hypothetical protein
MTSHPAGGDHGAMIPHDAMTSHASGRSAR